MYLFAYGYGGEVVNHDCPDCGRTKLVDEKFECCFGKITVEYTGIPSCFIAFFEGREEDGEFGWGATEEAAKADLLENYGD